MATSIHFCYNIEHFSFWNCSLGSITNISQVTSEGSHLSGGILLPPAYRAGSDPANRAGPDPANRVGSDPASRAGHNI